VNHAQAAAVYETDAETNVHGMAQQGRVSGEVLAQLSQTQALLAISHRLADLTDAIKGAGIRSRQNFRGNAPIS